MKELYPIGTVALLYGGSKRVMITGYMITTSEQPGKAYDYCGVIYPEGSLSSDQVLLFDHWKIEKVFAVGYRDEEYCEFMNRLQKVIETPSGEEEP